MVKRIRRNLDDIVLRRDPTVSLEDPRECKQEDDEKNRTNSNNPRYIRDPMKRKRRNNSSIYSEPDETVTYLDREVRTESNTDAGVISHLSPSQNLSGAETQASPEHVPLQFVNQGFNPDTTRNSMVKNQSEASDDLQVEYENAVEKNAHATCENNNEPIYQNTGELASLNNPDWERCNTMAISDIDKCP